MFKKELAELNKLLQVVVGKTISGVRHIEEDGQDEDLLVDFQDGTQLRVSGIWCNDSTGALVYHYTDTEVIALNYLGSGGDAK